jgi:trehalose 6-phosphate phosphatase
MRVVIALGGNALLERGERPDLPLCATCYLGDDLGDLAAFRALDQLAARGIGTARIAVRSDEAPAELLHTADVTVDAPEGAPALLRSLL